MQTPAGRTFSNQIVSDLICFLHIMRKKKMFLAIWFLYFTNSSNNDRNILFAQVIMHCDMTLENPALAYGSPAGPGCIIKKVQWLQSHSLIVREKIKMWRTSGVFLSHLAGVWSFHQKVSDSADWLPWLKDEILDKLRSDCSCLIPMSLYCGAEEQLASKNKDLFLLCPFVSSC